MELKEIIQKLYIVDKAIAKLLVNPDDNESLYTFNVILEELREAIKNKEFKGHVHVPNELEYLLNQIIGEPSFANNPHRNYGYGNDIIGYKYF